MKFNPDGQKYEFVSDFLTSLKYLYINEEKEEDLYLYLQTEENDVKRLRELNQQLIVSSLNLRIARNIIEDYRLSQNRLMIKIVDFIEELAEIKTALNNREREILGDMEERLKQEEQLTAEERKNFESRLEALAKQRKEASKNLLQASLVVQKLLISDQPAADGEYDRLGLTQEERKDLLEKLSKFSGKKFRGNLREGQSFLQGSVAVIRQTLENESFSTIDG